jgi:hypothetical protein
LWPSLLKVLEDLIHSLLGVTRFLQLGGPKPDMGLARHEPGPAHSELGPCRSDFILFLFFRIKIHILYLNIEYTTQEICDFVGYVGVNKCLELINMV